MLKWRTPKKAGETTEVPSYGYLIYRSPMPITNIIGMKPVQIVPVIYENLDEYSYRDMPPANGTYHYVVSSMDLARNESKPSTMR